ncbi:MAG: hypothetical protein Q8M88_04255 [Phenylobacterium sp.]|uniref:hypothetical protein n=1 Tax=Phenylobacterium sp. TaxID=1871053 RepID=UPI0027353EEF|nr:hypothetical protein [Phenylobacterium sp.]MDP3173628.1 hypothetical protein [Phenylobacterium sp.]
MRAHAFLPGLLAISLAACDQPEWTKPSAPGDHPPPAPAWAAPLIGERLREAFIETAGCAGAVDTVTQRFKGPPPGARIVGWAWDARAHQPATQIIVVRDGLIVGAGDGGRPRADVPAVRPDVTSAATGWQADARSIGGELEVLAVIGAGACPLGRITP